MAESLTVTDNRTGVQIEVPIEDGTIHATALKELGLASYDPAFLNTASVLAKDAVPIAVEGHWPSKVLHISTQPVQIGTRGLRRHKLAVLQPPARIVDEGDQRATRPAIFQPRVRAAIDLHQLAHGRASLT